MITHTLFLVYVKGMKGPEPVMVSDLSVLDDVNGKRSDRYLEHHEHQVATYVGCAAPLPLISDLVRRYPCKTTWPPPYDEPPLVLNPDRGPTPTTPAAQALAVPEPKPADEDYSNKFMEKYLGDRAAVG